MAASASHASDGAGSASPPALDSHSAERSSWIPLALVVAAQFLVSFNLSALAVCVRGIGDSFGESPTLVQSVIVAHSSFVAALIMIGSAIGHAFGSSSLFRTMVGIFGGAMIVVAISPNGATMVVAESIAGAAAGALIPTLVVLIGTSYRGRERARALAWLAASQAMAAVAALLVAGALGAWLGWRAAFASIAGAAAVLFVLSYRFRPVPRTRRARFDPGGLVLGGLAVALVIAGVNALPSWGWLMARDAAPYAPLGLSLAPLAIAAGFAFAWLFVIWERGRYAAAKATLVSPDVIGKPQERCAVLALFLIVALGAAVRYLISLYVEVVQGASSLSAAVAVLPYSVAVFAAAIVVVSLQERVAPRTIARAAFVLVAAGLALLAAGLRNDWGSPAVVSGLALLGLAEGALLTLLMNVLLATSSAEKAAEIGSLRSTTSSVAGALGTAVSGALLIGFLSVTVTSTLSRTPEISEPLRAQLDLTDVRFISNDRLRALLEGTAFDRAQLEIVLDLNTTARLDALRTSLAVLAALALLGVLPAGRLPRHSRAESATPVDVARRSVR
jgi:MFS family permease